MFKFFYFFISILFLVHCSDDTEPIFQVDCSKVLCTEVFITLSVEIRDVNGVKIALDDFQVTDADSGADLTREYTPAALAVFQEQGTYPLYDDSFVQEHPNEERSLLFTGFIQGDLVVRGTYVVAADCCHVSLVSGENVLLPYPKQP